MTNQDSTTFYHAIKKIEAKAKESVGVADLNHLRKIEMMGVVATVIGYITGAIFLNPISAYLIALGHYTSWMVGHYVLHGAYDKIPGIPYRLTSKGFSNGWRRYWDWFDWILPNAWKYEHNTLHHAKTGEMGDPDNVERLFKDIRSLNAPLLFKYLITILIAFTWKWSYYAPSTLMHLQKKEGRNTKKGFNFYRLFNPFSKNGFEFWTKCLLPYFTYRFLLIPAIFLPLGKQVVVNVFCVSVLADLFSNFHSFLMIGPNHTGEDLCKFVGPAKSQSQRYSNQILCTTNYSGQGWGSDFIHGFVNYHIEHHLWPWLTLLQYKKAANQLKTICAVHDVPYISEPVTNRFVKLLDICVGKSSIPVRHEPGVIINNHN